MNSLSWNKYSEIKPTNGSKCIVAVNSKGRSSAGVYTYFRSGDHSFWVKNGQVKCTPNDRWCYVETIVNSIADRLIDELHTDIY